MRQWSRHCWRLGRCTSARFISASVYDSMKAESAHHPGVDRMRAMSFLQAGDLLHARQALCEEVRLTPSDVESRRLLLLVDALAAPAVQPPQKVLHESPLFAMVFDALKTHTMLTWTRMFSLFTLAQRVCEEGIDGDFVECGSAGGGSAILMAVVARHFSSVERTVYACDTFAGMPPPSESDRTDSQHASTSNWGTGTCRGTEEHLRALARAFDVNVVTVPGLFQDTLPNLRVASGRVALLHCDADWYDSTKTALQHVAPAVQPGGVIQVDDYHYWAGCKQATDEVLGHMPWQQVDGNAVYCVVPSNKL